MFKYFLIGALVLGAVGKVCKVGKPEIVTAGLAAVYVAETAFWIFGILYWL
jgi:hypothetical protein